MKPLARVDQLTVETLGDETLVYDLSNNKAHCLNRTAAAVWRLCDGQNTILAIAARLRQELDATLDDSVVPVALQELSKANLLQQDLAAIQPGFLGSTLSRREMSIRAGLMVPVVASILVPTPAAAASGGSAPPDPPPNPSWTGAPTAGFGGH
jgi:Coenzyme PQQ synthesis protein D (PqqD)